MALGVRRGASGSETLTASQHRVECRDGEVKKDSGGNFIPRRYRN